MENIDKQIIKLYEEYIGLLGEEIRDLAPIAAIHGWTTKRAKQGAELRMKIAELKKLQ